VLLILIGSDLSMMEAFTSYGRPFHQRGAQMTVGPLNPADVAAMAGLCAAGAFDAALITGGLPIICARWENGENTRSFLARELANPVSPPVISAPSCHCQRSSETRPRPVQRLPAPPTC
jgi:uncharacterized protein